MDSSLIMDFICILALEDREMKERRGEGRR